MTPSPLFDFACNLHKQKLLDNASKILYIHLAS